MRRGHRFFAEEGFDAVSVDKVRTAAGVSNGSFFHLFDTKADLAAELLVACVKDYQECVATGLSDTPNAPEGVGAIVRASALGAQLIDNASTSAAGTVIDRDLQTYLTAEYKLNIVSPACGDRLACTATVVKSGRRLTVVEAKVHSHSGGDAKLVAVALATIANVDRAGLRA